ncbi:MAG TPA: thioredoxin domain-containing protein, partial [Ignavibacteriaceae bacterium]|nr:thioredoxin domain-containing protein [Ignavibacteriaceae bacterium]
MKKTNHLITEKSPYLLQHAYNPVDWYPWSEEAFEKAKHEDKPVFLSIGYSTCHWCHVMEKESFEDQEIAGLMNEAFVSIKVDREERPDIDGIYMSVCQMLTGSGGWPMTIIMTPDKKPFFAGTYFPKESRFRRPGMKELIQQLQDIWRKRREEVYQSASEIVEALSKGDEGRESGIDKDIFQKAYNEFEDRFDNKYGGFGSSPKFPSPHNFYFLLRFYIRENNVNALNMVEKTLHNMRLGGIYDHIGFGFHRYSTDREWLVPHFEKMLYDQALIAEAYIELFQITKNEIYRRTAEEILRYVQRDMTSPEGGFYSAEDADSEGVEGKFYLWTKEEIRNLLNEDSELISEIYNLKDSGNIPGENSGNNILHLTRSFEEVAQERNVSSKDLVGKMSNARKILFAQREKRTHPFKDNKILTDWNGLMISTFAKASQVFNVEEYGEIAIKAADFIVNNLIDKEGRLLHRYKDGEAGIISNIDDYAFFIRGLIDLYESTFNNYWLDKAIELNKDMIEYFCDEQKGGFFFTPYYGEKLIVRQKEIYDGAVPSGNSIAILNLLKLGRITGDTSL